MRTYKVFSVRYRSTFLSLLVIFGVSLPTVPVRAQSMVPHTLELKNNELEQTGIKLLQEAFQLAQFDQGPLALSRAKLAVQLLPDSAEAWALLGALYLNDDKPREGISALETSRRLKRDNAGVLFSLGSAYFRTEQYDRSRRAIEAGLKLKPKTADALFDLGNTHYKLGNYDQAISQYQLSYKTDKTLWPAINNIGLVQYEVGKIDQAIESWESAIALDDKASEPKLALGVALFIQGDKTAGIKLAQDALSSDNRYGEVDFLLENLWGDRLIKDTKMLLNTPMIQSTLSSFQHEDTLN